ncbi:hypothetical protein D9756_003709 [Leucocoprinus leucothites]|uniref:Uncharacterized protein n=1 Tax=Leucocoprinus leucothites TaxID=201217 RepID=A0A8H5DAM4_9AGAR|nr:hypothetical protein D9756_003709 [Leucoagaricus leucothites]
MSVVCVTISKRHIRHFRCSCSSQTDLDSPNGDIKSTRFATIIQLLRTLRTYPTTICIMKIPTSTSLLIATLAISSSSSALVAPSGDGHQEGVVNSSASSSALASSTSSESLGPKESGLRGRDIMSDPIAERGSDPLPPVLGIVCPVLQLLPLPALSNALCPSGGKQEGEVSTNPDKVRAELSQISSALNRASLPTSASGTAPSPSASNNSSSAAPDTDQGNASFNNSRVDGAGPPANTSVLAPSNTSETPGSSSMASMSTTSLWRAQPTPANSPALPIDSSPTPSATSNNTSASSGGETTTSPTTAHSSQRQNDAKRRTGNLHSLPLLARQLEQKMPHPKPLTNLASGVHMNNLDEQALTPRTPRSRFERQSTAEGQYDDVDIHPPADSETQTIPLLSAEPNRTSARQPAGRSKDASKTQRIRFAARFVDFPLILGTLFACFLFGLIVFSYKHPGQLQEYVGVKGPKPSPVADEAVKNTPPPIPPPKEAPLHPSEYVSQCRELQSGFMSHGDYWDRNSMNMNMNETSHEVENEETADKNEFLEGGGEAVCSKTITYLLDGEVGLLADLALIAQAAALARERNRTFFIDDTYWNRGKWTHHFQNPGPEPDCRAPHPRELVACPRTASHWVITAHTAKYHFGHAFSEHYENPSTLTRYGHNLNRLRPIFDAAHESFVSTIRPNSELASLIQSARQELKALIPPAASQPRETYISVHVRRGDRKHRFSSTSYTSITEYISYIEDTRARLLNSLSDAPVYFASDSPAAESEFADSYMGRYFSLRQSQDSALRRLASSQDYDQKEFNSLSLEERLRLTKGMVVDFALLSGMWSQKGEPISRAGVCTISSNVCRTLAVGLGWDQAFGRVDDMGYLDDELKGWVEVEEKGRIVPVWTAFELF